MINVIFAPLGHALMIISRTRIASGCWAGAGTEAGAMARATAGTEAGAGTKAWQGLVVVRAEKKKLAAKENSLNFPFDPQPFKEKTRPDTRS